MERVEYLKKCAKAAATVARSLSALRADFNDGDLVGYGGHEYVPTELRIWYDGDGVPHFSAVLREIDRNVCVVARLEDVNDFKRTFKTV